MSRRECRERSTRYAPVISRYVLHTLPVSVRAKIDRFENSDAMRKYSAPAQLQIAVTV